MREFLRQCRVYFVYAFFFSMFVNLLMLTLPIYMLTIFSRVITSRSAETLVVLTVAALGAYLMHGVLEILRGRLLLGASVALDSLASPKVIYSAVSEAARPGGQEAVVGLRDSAVLRGFLTSHAVFSIFDLPWLFIFLFVIYLFHPLLGMIATFGAIALLVVAYVNEFFNRKPLDELSARARVAGRYIDTSMRNAEVVSALGMLDNLTGQWRKLNDRVVDLQVETSHRANLMSGISRMVRLSLQIVMLGTGAFLVIHNHVSPGIMIAGTLLLSRALAPIDSAIQTWKGMVNARESYQRLSELVASHDEKEVGTELPPPRGEVQMERCLFAFPGAKPVIKGVSLFVEAGESVGVIGPSAAGKSTLARLLIGIWQPSTGIVRLDGADIANWPRNFLGPHIGYLPQDVELFAGSVGANIARLGEATPDEIIDAARRANAHEMIMRLPRAYDTEIGPSGARLSSGQRQRVALARALFRRPQLLVLDEPNANLDAEGEEALMKTLQSLREEGATVFVISHRPGVLASMDKILVLKDGQVDMFGPRAEIMTQFARRSGQALAGGPQVVAVRGSS